jgi:hypothetical protein
MVSVLGQIIVFFDKLGVYDVILPFLLVFTIVFAILEKTRVFGYEEFKGEKYTRKNLNSIVAFVIAFLVIASSKLVEAITRISANMVLLLILIVFFLLLVGTFYGKEEDVALKGKWRVFFMVIVFIGILLIFLDGVRLEDGTSWLEVSIGYVSEYWSSTVFATLITVALIIALMAWITKEPSPAKKAEKKEESK